MVFDDRTEGAGNYQDELAGRIIGDFLGTVSGYVAGSDRCFYVWDHPYRLAAASGAVQTGKE